MTFNWYAFNMFWLVVAIAIALVVALAWIIVEIEWRTGSEALALGVPIGTLLLVVSLALGFTS